MDQQSMRQHMHMHLYMHSQQQQQVAHFMNGHHNDTRFPLMIGGKYGSSGDGDEHEMRMPLNPEENNFSSKLDGDRSELNDDVFDGRSSERDTSPYDDPRDEESPQSRSESEEPGPRGAYSRSLTPPSEKHHEPSARPSLGENAAETITKPLATAVSALDLTRASSSSPEVSSASMYGATPASNSDNRRPSSHSPPQLASSSLNALAHLASNSSIMRPSGVPLMHNTADSEFRVRKMTTACEICNKPFTCQSALEIHLRIHTNERPYVCRVCDRGFTTKGNLKQHLLTHNINEVGDDFLEPVDTSPIPANSTCISPSNSPALSSNSQMNARKVPSEGNEISSAAKRTYPRHWCHICQKQFSSASSLQIHNRTHTGEKPFACSVCGRAFTTKGNLKVHMGTHVWGAGGSRRGRRISMDNPLISPWMQNTSNSNGNPQNQTLRVRQTAPHIPPVADPAMIYQQYAALASGLMGAKASADSRFHANGMINLHNAAAARLLQPPSNGHVTPASAASLAQQISANNAVNSGERPNNLAAASEWIWKAYQRTQEQVN
uniref:C2H2-type domain-containing protein n=1 Tax=Ciona savignyi TaxID=51511 RepID=H2ZEI3_CIOSA